MPVINKALTAVHFFATDADGGKVDDEAQFTLKVIIDGVIGAVAGSITEVDGTNAPGMYSVPISAAENNGQMVSLVGKSSTAGVTINPVSWSNISNVYAVNGDSTAADNLESAFDGTGYGIQAASALTTVALASGGITAATIATDAIDADAIAADAITSVEIADGSLTAAKFAADCITAAKIADGALTTAKISATVNANLKQINSSATGVSGFGSATTTVVEAVVHTGSSSSSIVSDTSALSSTDDAYVRRTLTFTGSSALANQSSVISDYVGSTKTFTVSVAFTGTPAENDTFIVT